MRKIKEYIEELGKYSCNAGDVVTGFVIPFNSAKTLIENLLLSRDSENKEYYLKMAEDLKVKLEDTRLKDVPTDFDSKVMMLGKIEGRNNGLSDLQSAIKNNK